MFTEQRCRLFRHRFNAQIKTVHDFVRAGFQWAAPEIAWVFSLIKAQVSDDRALVARFEIIPDSDRLHNLSKTRRYGIGLERLHADNYAFGDYVQMDSLEFQDVMREDLYFEYTMLYAQRGWPLMEQFNAMVMAITEHGLLHHWESEIVRNHLDLDVGNRLRQLATGMAPSAAPEVLRVAHIYGPLIMLAMGIVAATVAFAFEIAVYRRHLKAAQRQQGNTRGQR